MAGRHRDRSSSGPLGWAAVSTAGVLLVCWGLLQQQGDPPVPDRSLSLSAAQTSAPRSSTADQHSTDAAVRPGTASTGSTPTTSSGVDALPPAVPLSIEIPAIGVSSPLHALGLNADGTLQVPSGDRYDEAAWFDGSPTPGEIGPAVIEGHVTGTGFGPSVFFQLGALEAGDVVEVSRRDGSVATFQVYAMDAFPKNDFPTTIVYGNTRTPELRLITCSGEYDANLDAHVDNVVVFARLVDST
ncbi:class F sortase [Ornithinimicrobium sp. LYQ103]|uniref:class F sortase n=1 Tax=Ornithinimicrobium sp. LYQ103 TaxID=3378796 RepID=UPI003851FD0F